MAGLHFSEHTDLGWAVKKFEAKSFKKVLWMHLNPDPLSFPLLAQRLDMLGTTFLCLIGETLIPH